jgi:hypothetical protein
VQPRGNFGCCRIMESLWRKKYVLFCFFDASDFWFFLEKSSRNMFQPKNKLPGGGGGWVVHLSHFALFGWNSVVVV